MKSSKKPRSTKIPGRKQAKPKLGPKPNPNPNPNPRPRASSTADILGGLVARSKRTRINPAWLPHYRHLHELRDQILSQAGKLAKDATESTPSYSMHMADAATDSFDRDFALSMLSSDQDAVYEIEQAIKRIENGTYGLCEVTGKPIPKGRLAAIPWARFSAGAQRQLERDGALRHRQFGSFTSLPASEAVEVEDDEEPKNPTSERE